MRLNLLRQGVVYCSLLLPFSSFAESELRFPASLVDTEEHIYRLNPSVKPTIDPNTAINAERLAETLLDLLKWPSRSCRETPVTKRAKIILQKAGKTLGIKIEIDALPTKVAALKAEQQADLYCDSGKTAPESGNLIAFIPGTFPLPSWNLSFHLDTNQTKFEGYKRVGDIIRPAPGTPLGADDKAGLAIIAELIAVIRDNNIPHGDIRVVGLVAEEDSAVGAQMIAGEAFKGDILVSIDGTDPNGIGHAAPTMYSGYITVKTSTSHPAKIDDKKSVSACAVGARMLHEGGFNPDGHPDNHPDVVLHSYFNSCGVDNGRMTAKGQPAADYQYNTISPFWTASWQMRNLEGVDSAQTMVAKLAATIERICSEAGKERTPVACAITGTDKPKLICYTIPRDADSIKLLQTGFEATGNKKIRITAKQFGAFNGNFIKSRFDEEMLIVGTGANQIHTNEETVSIQGMVRVARGILASMLESYRYVRID